MKSRGSACPFDQISIIAFKRSPILRTRLWRIIFQCWTEKSIPSVWKHAAAILIHQKDTAENPANCRPICLEPVLLKVLTSVLRNRIIRMEKSVHDGGHSPLEQFFLFYKIKTLQKHFFKGHSDRNQKFKKNFGYQLIALIIQYGAC